MHVQKRYFQSVTNVSMIDNQPQSYRKPGTASFENLHFRAYHVLPKLVRNKF